MILHKLCLLDQPIRLVQPNGFFILLSNSSMGK